MTEKEAEKFKKIIAENKRLKATNKRILEKIEGVLLGTEVL